VVAWTLGGTVYQSAQQPPSNHNHIA